MLTKKHSLSRGAFWYTDDMNMLHGYVHVEPIKKKETTASGLYLVQEMGSYPDTGIVLDYGVEAFGYVEKGDTVIYSPYAAIELEDKTLVLPLDNIYASIKEEKDEKENRQGHDSGEKDGTIRSVSQE